MLLQASPRLVGLPQTSYQDGLLYPIIPSKALKRVHDEDFKA